MTTYAIQIVGVEHAVFPQNLRCNHGCPYIIQLIDPETGDITLEMCPLSAEQFAGTILDAIELCHMSK